MLWRILLTALVCLSSLAAPVWAQTTTTANVGWNQPGVAVAADVANWQFTLLPNPTESPITLVHTCVPAATTPASLNCTATVPNWVRRPLNATLTATNIAGSATSAPLVVNPPGTPGGLSVSVTVTVTTP